MSTGLGKLLEVRSARLEAAKGYLARMAADLAAAGRELAAVDAELRQIGEQRNAWEQEWQSWLRGSGAVHHGQEYNLYHLQLTAWENDAREQREEVQRHFAAANARVAAARAARLEAERRYRQMADRVEASARSLRARRASTASSSAIEDLVMHRWARRGAP